MKILGTIGLIIFLLSGCAVWPSLQDDNAIDSSTGADLPCYTSDPMVAQKCALFTINELNDLLGQVGKYNRGTAYAAIGLGTVTGGVLAFDGSEDILKGLAILSGALLGMNAVVDADTQFKIYEKALKDMTCALNAFNAIQNSSIDVGIANSTFQNQRQAPRYSYFSRDSFLVKSTSGQRFSALSASEQQVARWVATERAVEFESISQSTLGTYDALDESQSTAGRKLSDAVMAVRAEVRANLAKRSTSLDDLSNNQTNRIVDMTGSVVSRRAELQNQLQSTAPVDDQTEDIANEAREVVRATSEVSAVFRECVDPATQREIER